MKRVLLAGIGCVCLALAGVAHGATHHYEGNTDGHIVAFDAKTRHGEIVKVVQFAYAGFSMPCDAGMVPFSGSYFKAKVNDKRRFKVKPYQDNRAVLAGKFSKSGLTATGTLITDGSFPGVGHCEGEQAWAVAR
ncbi:MAG: hypothetical protein ABI726_10050 [bacterium]